MYLVWFIGKNTVANTKSAFPLLSRMRKHLRFILLATKHVGCIAS